jgi:hypothetical protein
MQRPANPLGHARPLPPPQPGDGTGVVLPIRRVLYGLFFEPHILFLLQHDRWSRAFRLMALASFLSGLAVGASKVPRILEATRDWASWWAVEVGTLRLEDGELAWERPQVVPHTTRHRGWRVDFVGRNVRFGDGEELGPEKQGIWLAPERAYFWWRSAKAKITFVPLLEKKKAWGLFETQRIWPEGLVLSGEEFNQEANRIMRQAIPALLLHEGIMAFFQVLLYTVIFALIPVLLRSPIAVGGPARVFTFYLYASVPPLLIAGVYASLNLPYLDHALVFVMGFVVYLALAVRGLNRKQQDPPQTDFDF